MLDEKIDFVVLWVDGGDRNWLEEKNKYAPIGEVTPELEAARFRDWNNMKYWFRAIEKFTPWVNKIHFVTYGHLPKFLNTNNKKLNIVCHDSIIDNNYLPTFNSAAIEVNIHKIEGLADKFVYFNDDTFITSPMKKEDFFVDNLPCAEGLEEALTSIGDGAAFAHHLLNDIDVINKYFDKRKQYRKNVTKYFNFKYGVQNIRNLSLLIWKNYTGFKNSHLPTAYLKKVWEEVWEAEEKRLLETSSHKFRSYYDLNQYVFRQWQIAKGEFFPQLVPGRVVAVTDNNVKDIAECIKKQNYKMLCINDDQSITNFDEVKKIINEAFEEVLPEKSSFEK